MWRPLPFKEYKTLLNHLLAPNYILESVLDIPLDNLYNNGHTTLLLDIDNTLLSRRERLLNLDILQWLERARNLGFKTFAVSNNSSKRRILRIAQQSQLKGVYFACKPFPYSAEDLIEKENIKSKECIVVGDQVFTDILMGNLLGATSILVNPVDQNLSMIKTIKRDFEMFVLRLLDTT